MGTKQVSTQTNAFAPAGMGAYNALMPQMQGVLQSFMQNPMQAGYLNMLLQQGLGGARQLGARGMQNITGNLAAGGFGGQNMPAFLQQQMGQAGRATSGMEANTYIQNLLNASNLKMQAAQQAGGFRPLQTGATTTQQTTGLGTWLPTLLAGGLGMATGGMGGILNTLLGHYATPTPGSNMATMSGGFGQLPQSSMDVGLPSMPLGVRGGGLIGGSGAITG